MRRIVTFVGLLAATIVIAAGPAGADEVSIRSVDTTALPTVKVSARVSATGDPDPSSFTVTENGHAVPNLTVQPIAQSSAEMGVVLVVDTSISMRDQDRLASVKAAAKQLVAQKLPNEHVAIVTGGDPARQVVGFTTDPAPLNAAIDSLTPAGSRTLWDGLSLANGLLTTRSELQGDIVLLAGGADQGSQIGADAVAAAAVAAKAAVFAVGAHGAASFDGSALQSLASRTDGTYHEAADSAAIAGALAAVQQDVGHQYIISYTTADRGSLDITVRAGSASAHALAGPDTIATGANTAPPVVAPGKAPSFLRSNNGKWFATGLVLAAAGLLAFGLMLLLVKDRPDLDAALRPYSGLLDEEEEDEAQSGLISDSGIVRRAVDTTARIAEDRGLLAIVEQRLEQASLPLRAAEAIFFWVFALVLSVALGLIVGGLFGAALVGIAVGIAPAAVLNFLASKRKRKFVSLLPDMLQLLSSTLRAGYSLLQGIEAVSQEVEDPMGSELRRVLIEARLGRPLEEALQEASDRMASSDFDWAIMAIRVQREVGGNLAELLDTVGETMVQRERLRRDVKSLTAEGRMSAVLLGSLPVGIGLIMYSLNPGYMGVLFHDSLGKTLLIAAVVLAVAGFFWMKKMIEIEA